MRKTAVEPDQPGPGSGGLGAATALVRDTRSGQETLLARANAAVDRANEHLDRTEAVSASMDELGTGMEELAGQVNALAGFGKTMAGAVVTGPVGKAAAVAYGVRHAVGLRRGSRRRTLHGHRPACTAASCSNSGEDCFRC